MSLHNWFHQHFKDTHKFIVYKDVVDDVLSLLEYRGKEYLNHNKEIYKDLYIQPDDDILNSKPQIIQQVKEELREFLELVLDHDVKDVLQIGLGHFGSTQFCLSFLCDKVVSVEYDIKNISNYVDREIFYNQTKEYFIYGDSTDKKVVEIASSSGPYDCIFIDGNHEYEYVKKDYENYINCLRPGGICAFHDALLEGDRYGTPKVLRELKENIKFIKHSKEVGIAYFIKE